ncbi:hypothetical protein C2G38_2171300 [Gigaspora rosea]|uniref:Uncharacterized protein n=1 Tax=Gigaspora rosea TaxID=44941 RepID=A0A397VNA2_9GLOM|nr:hypothetical protein C2G38_2171300 [Gigaspora rosea]
MIKWDRENELEETKVHHHNIHFEEPLDDLNKALEIKPKDISALEKENNKVKNLRLTHFSKKKKEVLADFNCERKINSNEELPKRADRNNLTEKYRSLKDNSKWEDICATGVTSMVKNEVVNKGKEKDKKKCIIIEYKMRDKELKENKERKGVSNSGIRLEAQKVILMNRTFYLSDLLEGTIEKYGKKANDKKINLILNCDIDVVSRYVKSDPERVKFTDKVEINGGEIKAESQFRKESKFWFTWNIEPLSIPSSLLKLQFDEINYFYERKTNPSNSSSRKYEKCNVEIPKKVYAFEPLIKELVQPKDNKANVMKAILELRGLEINHNNLVIIFIAFPSNKVNEVAEKLIRCAEGTASVIYTPLC